MSKYITLHKNGDGYLAASLIEASSQQAAVAKKQSALANHLRVFAVSDALRGEAGSFVFKVVEQQQPNLVPTTIKINAL